MNKLFVLERKSRAGVPSPALDTFIMSGFVSENECLEVVDIIAGGDSRTRITPFDDYLSINKRTRFRDETGTAGVIYKNNGGYSVFPLMDISANLIKREVMIINVLEKGTGMIFDVDEPAKIKAIADNIRETIMLGKECCGSMIYRPSDETSIDIIIKRATSMHPGVRFLIVYQNPTVETMIDTENKLFASDHDSIVITDSDTMYQISIEDATLSLSVLDNSHATRVLIKE